MGPADLAVVATLAETQSFSAAARRLGVAHTTVARRLRDMEAYYSARLFERSAHGVVPTIEGERLVALARRMEAELLAVESDIRGQDQTLTGHVRLSTVDALAWRYMSTLAAFRKTNPGIELSVDISPVVRSLSRREAEMALRLSNAPDEALHGRRVGRFTFVPAVREDLVAHFGADRLPWVEFGDRDCAVPTSRWMKANVAPERVGASVPTPLLMRRANESGLGAGLVPTELLDGLAGLRILDERPAFEMDIWLLTAPELRGLARIRAVFDAFAGRT